MGLEQVKEEIIAQAKKQAQQIIAQAEQEAKVILQKAEEEVSAYEKNAVQHAQDLQSLMERKQLASARFDAQRLILNTKKDAIEEVVEGVKHKLAELTESEREKFLKKLLEKAKQEIDVDTVFVNKNDKHLIKSQVKQVKEEDISGGLIAQNKDDTISVNLSVADLLETAHNEMLVKVSEVLFHE